MNCATQQTTSSHVEPEPCPPASGAGSTARGPACVSTLMSARRRAAQPAASRRARPLSFDWLTAFAAGNAW